MNLLDIFHKFPNQEACIEHLENVRYKNGAFCPLCGCTENVKRKSDGDRVGRWNCHDCHSSFNVLSGTILSKTKIPLQKWFMAIAIMVNAKKSISCCQLARDLGLTFRTALTMQHKIRAEMARGQVDFLQGIIEADETYVGGRPRKANKRDDDTPNKRGRGTNKTPVIGAVERGGKVVAKVATDLTGKGIVNFVKNTINPDGSMMITDEYKAYNAVHRIMPHAVVNHQQRYADGMTHTNTIEGFWSLLKRAFVGFHHHYSVRWMPLFVAESCWKYNKRGNADAFGTFVRGYSHELEKQIILRRLSYDHAGSYGKPQR